MERGMLVSGHPEDEYEELGSHLGILEWSNMTNTAFWMIHLLAGKIDSLIYSKLFTGCPPLGEVLGTH